MLAEKSQEQTQAYHRKILRVEEERCSQTDQCFMKILHKEFDSKEENLSLSSLGKESRVRKHLLSWTGLSSMTLIKMNLRPRVQIQ